MYKSDELVRVVHEEIASALRMLDVGQDTSIANQITINLCAKLHGPWALYFPSADKAKRFLGVETRDATIRRLHRIDGLSVADVAKRYGLSERHVRRILFTDD